MKLVHQIEAILDAQPSLHVWGLGKPRGPMVVDLDAAREELLTPNTIHAIAHARDWCQRHLTANAPHPRKDASTYHWKHRYENSHDGRYIPNGAFAVAAALAGLPITWTGYNPTIHAHESRQSPITEPRLHPTATVEDDEATAPADDGAHAQADAPGHPTTDQDAS